MTKNEIKFVDFVVNHLHYVEEAQENIKECFGLDSEYDEEAMTLHIKAKGINEDLSLSTAKQYVNENYELLGLDVVYDFK